MNVNILATFKFESFVLCFMLVNTLCFFAKLYYFSRGEKKNRKMNGIDRIEEATKYFRIRSSFQWEWWWNGGSS